MNPGDIVLIRFPQTDLQLEKLRPALVIATAPGHYEDVLLALISSRTHQAVPEFDELIEPYEADYTATGLKVRSVIRLARLASVNISSINARLGKISPRSSAAGHEPIGSVVEVWQSSRQFVTMTDEATFGYVTGSSAVQCSRTDAEDTL